MKNPRIAFSAACSVLALAFDIAQARAPSCDRVCLESYMSGYLISLTAHDPKRLPLSPCVTYVENGQILPIGTGLWPISSSLGKYRHDFSDPESRQVATITTLKENGVPVIYIVRLALAADGSITEIETQITRDSTGAGRYEKMGEPEAVWLETVPAEKRISRAKLISQTGKYYSGMERNDPKGNYSFFDAECNRLEDGLQTTNMKDGDPYGHSNDTAFASLTCEQQFQTGFLGFVTKIRDRRFPVVDEERQAVFAITTLDHNGTVRELPSVNGTSSPIPAYFDVPRTLPAMEAFRLRGEKLFRIEMTLTEAPYGMRSPYPGGSPVESGKDTNSTLPDPCGRACLESVVDQVLQAMLSHDTSRLPLADDVRYSENGQFISLKDGLWGILGAFAKPGVDDYAARFSDLETGTAGYWGLIREHITPGVLSLRVKVSRGKITEIEALAVRAESRGDRGGTVTLMRPDLPVEWAGDSLGVLNPVFKTNVTRMSVRQVKQNTTISEVVSSYFDSLEHHAPTAGIFSPTCTRRDNGVARNTTCAAQISGMGDTPNGLHNHTTTVRDRRILVADSSRGVALAVAIVDSPATASDAATSLIERVPSSYMVPQLIKIESNRIEKVEGMVKWMPFGYRSAWGEVLGCKG